jgi:hypothetical protein
MCQYRTVEQNGKPLLNQGLVTTGKTHASKAYGARDRFETWERKYLPNF